MNVLCLLTLPFLFNVAKAQEVVVLDWEAGFNDESAQFLTINAGDSLLFEWDNSHNVHLMADSVALDNCDFSGSEELASTSVNSYLFETPEAGFYYFSCEVGNHCNYGQILTLEVLESSLPSIAEIAVSDDTFSTLVAAVAAAGLVDTLSSEGTFTVFAPTNDAFANLPDGTLDALLQPENVQQLTDILLYHVLGSVVTSSDLSDGLTATTLQGSSVTVMVTGGVMINDANVILADVEASNGIIHVIDAVLLPPEPNEDCPEDIDSSGSVGFGDILIILSTWGTCMAIKLCIRQLIS